MNKQDQAVSLEQMPDILACFQRYKLLDSVREYEGLSFDESGQFVSAPLSILDGGPFFKYEAFVRNTIESELSQADKDPHVNDWRNDAIRRLLDTFLARGLHQVITDRLDSLEMAFVRVDFSTDKLLYDKSTKRLTAILDFDFAPIATIAKESFRSLNHGISRIPSTRDGEKETKTSHKAMLEERFPKSLPPPNEEVD